MPQLFSRTANNTVRAVIISCVAVAIGVPLALLAFARTPTATGQYRSVSQPIRFSHPLHVNGQRIDCRYCHFGAQRDASAGMPPTQACLPCHSEAWIKSDVFAPIRASLAHDQPVPWRRVTSLPDFVYFNHTIHTRKGIGCESCHGRVDLMPQVYQTASLAMVWCLECHRHPERYIRPREEITTMGWHPHEDQDSLGARLVEHYQVRSITTCTACHR